MGSNDIKDAELTGPEGLFTAVIIFHYDMAATDAFPDSLDVDYTDGEGEDPEEYPGDLDRLLEFVFDTRVDRKSVV